MSISMNITEYNLQHYLGDSYFLWTNSIAVIPLVALSTMNLYYFNRRSNVNKLNSLSSTIKTLAHSQDLERLNAIRSSFNDSDVFY